MAPKVKTKNIKGTGFVHIGDLMQETYNSFEALFEKHGMITGVPTGFRDLDQLTSGLQRSDLIILAGRPSMGKTALALNIARNVAVKEKVPVAVFSVEMSKEQVAVRLLCAEAKIDGQKLRAGYVKSADWKPLHSAADVLSKSSIYIDDSACMTVRKLRAKARRVKLELGIGLVFIDYLQLMEGAEKEGSREQEISAISRGLKQIAKELDTPVIALSQLNRSVEDREDKRPGLADLRESGAIEQDADLIIFVYREEYYFPDRPECHGLADLIVGKQRNGPVGTITLVFKKEHALFSDRG